MTTLIIIAITLLFTYIITICLVNRSIPSSLSASVFYLQPKGAWLWTLVVGIVAGITMPVIISITPDMWRWLAFLAIAGLMAVAVCPLVKDKGDVTYAIHISGALLCGISSQVLLAICQPWLLLAWIPWIIAFAIIRLSGRKWESYTFWAEMVCFVDTFAYCLIFAIK